MEFMLAVLSLPVQLHGSSFNKQFAHLQVLVVALACLVERGGWGMTVAQVLALVAGLFPWLLLGFLALLPCIRARD